MDNESVEQPQEINKPQTKSNPTPIGPPNPGRRRFLSFLGALGLSAATGYNLKADTMERETATEAQLIKSRIKSGEEWTITTDKYKFKGSASYLKQPAKFHEQFFDVTTSQYIDQSIQGSILLSSTDVFADRRDVFLNEFLNDLTQNKDLLLRNLHATPELLNNNPLFLEIISRADEINNNLQKKAGGQYSEFHKPLAIATAITEILQFDIGRTQRRLFSTLDEEGNQGDCQRFTAFTAFALARNGVASDVMGFHWKAPNGKRYSHLCNVVNIDNTACVIDTTHSNEILTISDYFKKYPEGGPVMNKEIYFDSVFPDHPLPWENPDWIGKQNDNIKMGSSYVTEIIANIIENNPLKIAENKTEE